MYGRLLQFAPTCAIVDFAELGVNSNIRKQLSKLSTSDLALCCQVLRYPPPANWSRVVQARDINPWYLVPRCHVLLFRSRDFSVPDRRATHRCDCVWTVLRCGGWGATASTSSIVLLGNMHHSKGITPKMWCLWCDAWLRDASKFNSVSIQFYCKIGMTERSQWTEYKMNNQIYKQLRKLLM